MKADRNLLKKYIRALVESRIRETDITDGSRVPFGSKKHVADLEFRIADLERWRDRQRRGSEARANYARLIGRLRSELRAASRYSERKASETLDRAEGKPDDDLLVDDDLQEIAHTFDTRSGFFDPHRRRGTFEVVSGDESEVVHDKMEAVALAQELAKVNGSSEVYLLGSDGKRISDEPEFGYR